MGWLLRDERNMRRHRPPAQHHEPPLGAEVVHAYYAAMRIFADEDACGDCGWTPEGEFEKCEEHKEDV